GSTAASGSSDESVIVWDVASGTLLHRLQGHTQTVYSVAFTPDGTRVVSVGGDGLMIVWDVSSGEMVQQIPIAGTVLTSVAITPDGTSAVVAANSATSLAILLIDLNTGELIRQFDEVHTA